MTTTETPAWPKDLVCFVDPENGTEHRLRPREATAVIVALQSMHADVGYELGKLITAIRQGKTMEEIHRAADGCEHCAVEIGRHGYPEMTDIGTVLALALDGEGYAEHVEAHIRPHRDDPHPWQPEIHHGNVCCEVCGYDEAEGDHAV